MYETDYESAWKELKKRAEELESKQLLTVMQALENKHQRYYDWDPR